MPHIDPQTGTGHDAEGGNTTNQSIREMYPLEIPHQLDRKQSCLKDQGDDLEFVTLVLRILVGSKKKTEDTTTRE